MNSLEQTSVSNVIQRVPGIVRTLREYRIDPTNRMLLSHAAAAVSANVDEVLAVAEVRLRRAMRSVEVEQLEYEFMH